MFWHHQNTFLFKKFLFSLFLPQPSPLCLSLSKEFMYYIQKYLLKRVRDKTGSRHIGRNIVERDKNMQANFEKYTFM